jgi:uncharacterized spore protein YtfJ
MTTTDTMTTADYADARSEAERAATGAPQDAILEKLVEKVGGQATVKAVFGDPIVRGDKTVIPVAKVRWGFGGGSGTGSGPSDASGGVSTGSGTGGGGGVTAEPIGYLEIDEEGASFRPIAAPYPSPIFLIAAGLGGALVIRAIARLVRG